VEGDAESRERNEKRRQNENMYFLKALLVIWKLLRIYHIDAADTSSVRPAHYKKRRPESENGHMPP